ncbi:MAG: hypothetical protein ABG776_00270 [Cyanobacteria bacterium J06555_13]
MLYLNAPFHIIEGVSVYADHADPLQFYYLPAIPKLTTEFDPVTEQLVPQLSLIKYRGDAGNGGFLNFGVDLAVEPDTLEEVRRQLQQLMRLRDTPRLAPVVVEDGSVRLLILGKQTPDETNGQASSQPGGQSAGGSSSGSGADTDQPQFVIKIDQAAKPALYGDNQAIFSVQLDSAGVTVIEDSLKGELMPVGVVYSLDFLALREAFNVSIVAEWDRVQTHLQESFSAKAFFSSVEIDKVVDELIEDQVVKIEVDTFIPEGEDSSGVLGRRNQAIADFKDMILDGFFKPSLDPIKENENKFADTVDRLSQIAPAGGARFSYKKVDVTRIDRKRMNLSMNERTTVRRSIHPQAHLKGLFRFLRDSEGEVDLSRFVREVTLDDPWFKNRETKARSLINFANDAVDSVNLTLHYGDQPKTIGLDPENPSGLASWNSLIEDQLMQREVRYSYRVNFKDVDTTERPGVLTSGELLTLGDQFEVNPRSEGLYYIDDIQLGVSDRFPWDVFTSVEVKVRYLDDPNQIKLTESFVLKQDTPEVTWKRFRLDRALDAFDYKVIYRGVDSHDREISWTTTDQERLTIANPTPKRRTVTVIPAVSWALVSMVFVDLTYQDEANDIWRTASLFFDKDTAKPQNFVVDLIDLAQRQVSYTIKILLMDNRLIEVPPSVTTIDKIFVRADMAGHRVIELQPEAVEFASRQVVRIEASLMYEDAEGGLHFADNFTFSSMRDRATFEYDYADVQKQAYYCKLKTIFTNGLATETDLGSLKQEQLSLPVG